MLKHQVRALRPGKGKPAINDEGWYAVQSAAFRGHLRIRNFVGALASREERLGGRAVDATSCGNVSQDSLVADIPTFNKVCLEQAFDDGVLSALFSRRAR